MPAVLITKLKSILYSFHINLPFEISMYRFHHLLLVAVRAPAKVHINSRGLLSLV